MLFTVNKGVVIVLQSILPIRKHDFTFIISVPSFQFEAADRKTNSKWFSQHRFSVQKCVQQMEVLMKPRNAKYLSGMISLQNSTRRKTATSQSKTLSLQTSFEQFPGV